MVLGAYSKQTVIQKNLLEFTKNSESMMSELGCALSLLFLAQQDENYSRLVQPRAQDSLYLQLPEGHLLWGPG